MFKTIEGMQSFEEIQHTTKHMADLIFNMDEYKIFKETGLKVMLDLRIKGLESCIDLLKKYEEQL